MKLYKKLITGGVLLAGLAGCSISNKSETQYLDYLNNQDKGSKVVRINNYPVEYDSTGRVTRMNDYPVLYDNQGIVTSINGSSIKYKKK
jgi:hypothetical protein